MKPSRYNLYLPRPDGRYAIYNTARGSIALLPRVAATSIRKAGGAGMLMRNRVLSTPLQAQLAELGILVPERRDELQVPIRLTNRSRFAPGKTQVVVFPTQQCNLDCAYCYQKPRLDPPPPMDARLAQRTGLFIREAIRANRAEAVSVGFFGGEPLMNQPACQRIIDLLTPFCETREIFIEFTVTTNGYLLPELKDSPLLAAIAAFHVTLDGDRATHDRVRITRSGKGSWQRIMDGLSMLVERGIRTIVRLHQNRLTDEGFIEVLDELYRQGLRADSAASIYCTTYNACAPDVGTAQCHRELAEQRNRMGERQLQLARLAREHALAPLLDWGFSIPNEPLEVVGLGCTFAGCAGYAVDCDGAIYKCPEQLDDSTRVGRIGNDGMPKWNGNHDRLLAVRWWESGCRDCSLLPVCGTGCMLDGLPESQAECASIKQRFVSAIERYIEHSLPQMSGVYAVTPSEDVA
ncbi:MAG: radical SAM protein [Candidatus Thiodiazotropha sp.]